MILLSVCLPGISYASNAISTQHQEDGWLKNGAPISDSDNIKSKDGFGAQMWIINDESFFDDWNRPETPSMTITETAIRNRKIFIIFLFINPGIDQASKANVVANVLITDPAGGTYGEFKDVEVWQRVYDAPRNSIQLGVAHLGLVIEDDEQLGTYRIEAEVKDQIKDVTLELQTEFTAKEK